MQELRADTYRELDAEVVEIDRRKVYGMADEVRGPVMIAATTMLRPPAARISKISENVTLPRSVSLKSIVGGGVGFFVGVIVYFLGVVVVFGFDLTGLMLTLSGFATAGVVIVNFSPLKGENWGTWFSLQAGAARSGRVRIDGQDVRAYIGIAPLPYSAAGVVHVITAAQEVLPGSVDERGALLPADKVRENALRRAAAEQSRAGSPMNP